jgi:hypothetical protein
MLRRLSLSTIILACGATTRAIPTEVSIAPQSSASAIVLTPAAPDPTPPPAAVERFGNLEQFDAGSSHAPDLLLGSPIEIPRAGRVIELGVIVVTAGPSLVLALYTDDHGQPGDLIASTRATPMVVGEMHLPVEAEVPISRGKYWIMGDYDKLASIGIDYSDSDAAVAYTSVPFGNRLPDPFPSPPTTYQGQRFNYWVVLR